MRQTGQAPRLRRRLACFVYDGVLLFGVVAAAGLVYALITNQRHALVGTHGLQAWLFVVIGSYFVWFWSRHGQTLAMRTWHIRVVTADGSAPTTGRAIARYLLCWMWVIPSLATLYFAELKSAGAIAATLIGYAALAWLHPSRQYWHDTICGTRLIDTRSLHAGRLV